MRRVYKQVTIAFLFLFIGSIVAQAAEAATLKFDPTSSAISVGGSATPKVTISSGDVQIAGSDIYIVYDPAYLEPQTVTAGDHFPIVTNNVTPGKVYISAVVDNSSQYKTGDGTIATVSFKGLKNGTTTLTYYCDLTKNDTSKIVKNDINATNVIECGTLGTHTITIGDGGGTITPGGTNGGTNSGGTTTGGTTYSSTQNIQQLPQSGVYENVVGFALPGVALLVFGLAMRLLLRV